MGKIQRLDAHLTNMIAAGEVVERPSGIVKELVENAIDAQATSIDVSLKEGGITFIQVQDNGIGMDASDASMAFERHATSKLHNADELWSIQTMGFRGEALPSIASVSQVRLLTNNKQESTMVHIQYGKLMEAKPYYAPEGTTITVENLFQRTPARLKHLKTKQYETAMVSSVLEKFALGHPDIAFSLNADGKQLCSFNGSGSLAEVMHTLYGKDTARSLAFFEAKDYDFTVSGALVIPTTTRASNNYITLFVNHRLIRHYRIQKVILEAFADYLFNERYPIVVMNIQGDPQLVDVNVHPTKWEIRLSKQQQLEELVRNTIQDCLRNHMAAPEIVSKPVEKEKVEFTNLLLEEPVISPTPISVPSPTSPATFFVAEEEQKVQPIIHEEAKPRNPILQSGFPMMAVIGQLHGKYILAEAESGLYIIDQHAAQERYNYERFQKLLLEKKAQYQPLLIPLVVEAGTTVLTDFASLQQLFHEVQLEIEPFGSDSLLCREIPIWMAEIDLPIYFRDLLDLYQNDQKTDLLTIRDTALESLACHASVKFNKVLNMDEMKEILIHLQCCENPFKCPHGRPTFIQLTEAQLKKEFLR